VTVCAIVFAALVATAAPAFAAADTYEPDNTAASAKTIPQKRDVVDTGAQWHTFTDASDVDWVKFKPTYDTDYNIKVYQRSLTDPAARVKVTIYRLSKGKWRTVVTERVAGVDKDDLASSIDLYIGFKTTYAIRLRPASASGAGKDYGIRVQKQYSKPSASDGFEDLDDTRAGARAIAVRGGFDMARSQTDEIYMFDKVFTGTELHSIYNPSGSVDEDWYYINAGDGQQHTILLYSGLAASRQMDMQLLHADGTVWGENNLGESCFFWWTFTTYEPIYLRIYAKDSGKGYSPYWYRIGVY
jgi:hypothetical protein